MPAGFMSWAEIRKSIRERRLRSARSHGAPPPPISGRCATIAFVLTVGQAIGFAILLNQLALGFKGHGDIVYLIFMGIAYLFGSGTLVAAFYDRTWWTEKKRGWILGFNLLTLGLTMPVGGALKVYWFSGS